jgi:catechol 2,3-dioxygenase-like lactoylglutathione lyase family enzyme
VHAGWISKNFEQLESNRPWRETYSNPVTSPSAALPLIKGVSMLRRILSSLALVGAVAALACSSPAAVAPSAVDPHVGLPATDHSARGLPVVRSLVLTVSDLERSIEMFQALDFRLEDQHYLRGKALAVWAGVQSAEVRVAHLALGSEQIELRQFVTPPGRAIAADSRSNDQIFQHMAIVVRDMDEAFSRLQRIPGIELVSGVPQTIPLSNPTAGGIRALYFRDRDHHNLELIWFPPNKGQKRWQSGHSGVFLGIDHSAIAVSDTTQSQLFYESLGFVLAGKSLNYGAEQAALSGVEGARVEITGLAPQAGASVEFLSYLEPGPGRPAPSDSAVNDLWHWEINVEVPDLAAARGVVMEHGGRARAVADVSSFDLGYRFASLVQDRDGHYLQLLQR